MCSGRQPRSVRDPRDPGPPPPAGGPLAPEEDQAAPAAGAPPLPGGREAGAGLAGEARGGVPQEERGDRKEPGQGQGIPEEP